jgi:hypothetical protein
MRNVHFQFGPHRVDDTKHTYPFPVHTLSLHTALDLERTFSLRNAICVRSCDDTLICSRHSHSHGLREGAALFSALARIASPFAFARLMRCRKGMRSLSLRALRSISNCTSAICPNGNPKGKLLPLTACIDM